MVFIDGAGLRLRMKEWFGSDRIKLFEFVSKTLLPVANTGGIRPELLRTYFYDAIVEPTDARYKEQEAYFSELRQENFCQVRLGRLIATERGDLRQKGVDALMAIDMVAKAYEDQYDIAVVLAGDDDFVDTVQAVRDAGKRVCGAWFPGHASERLRNTFDISVPLDRERLARYAKLG